MTLSVISGSKIEWTLDWECPTEYFRTEEYNLLKGSNQVVSTASNRHKSSSVHLLESVMTPPTRRLVICCAQAKGTVLCLARTCRGREC